MLIPSEQLIIHALDHEIRRTILQLLYSRPYSYTELMEFLRIDSGKFYYHLRFLGKKAVEFLTFLSENVSVYEIPDLSIAYTHHFGENESHLNLNYLKAVVETVDLICNLFIYLYENSYVLETLNDFISQIKTKALSKKHTLMNRIETSAISFEEGTKLRNFWCGVYDTLGCIQSTGRNMGKYMGILKRQALELQKAQTQYIGPKEVLPNLQKIISDELEDFPIF